MGAGPVGRERNPVAVLLLMVFTFGIYWIFWAYHTVKELRDHTQIPTVTSPERSLLILLVPVVNQFWAAWRIPGWIRAAEDQHGQGRSNAPLMFALSILGPTAPIGIWMMQSALNEHWRYHAAQGGAVLPLARLA